MRKKILSLLVLTCCGSMILFAQEQEDKEISPRLWTVGATIGTTFSYPWLTATLRGTIAPFDNSFAELGFELGLVSGKSDVDYYSIYPHAHYAYYSPFRNIGGWYAGGGFGFMIASFDAYGVEHTKTGFVIDIVAGINLFDMIDISYTLRTNFSSANNKLAVGYTYRFK